MVRSQDHCAFALTVSRTAYKFTRNVYDKFLPEHVKRVKSAVIQLPNPKDFLVKSFTSMAGAEGEPELPNSREIALSSQETGSNKKQKLPPKVMLQQENGQQKEQIDKLKEQIDQERNENKDRIDQFMRQLAQRDEQIMGL